MTKNKSTTKKKKSSSKSLTSLNKELKEKEEKLLRSIADFRNYQKRMEKELILKEEETKRKYLSELIDLYELLKKAYNDDNPKDGLKLLINNVENFLNKEQIEVIDCVGKKFNHNLHHAITTIEKKDCEDNTIVEEVKRGYLVNDKLLRPSHVIVSKKKD
jgi:molecular chaperone GrpE